MEDKEPTPSTTPPPAARTAQALRELHDRARTALAAQRERMGQLEAQLTNQLDSIADTIAEQVSAHGGQGEQAQQAQQALDDVAQLRSELERTRLEWNVEREAWQAERAELATCDAERLQAIEEQQAETQARQQALDDRASELNHQDRELRQRQELLESEATLVAEQQSQITATESAIELQRTAVAEREQAVETSQVELEQGRTDLAAREQALQTEQSSLASTRAALQAEREALQAERDAMAQESSALAANQQLNESESAARLASLEHQLTTERIAWDRERAGVEEQRRLLAKERDDLATALEAARGELTTARAEAAAAGELEALKELYEAAHDDIERLGMRVVELEQELNDRPEVIETDSTELVELQAERDAMAKRIAALEEELAAAQAAKQGSNASEEQSDLERRFELALEDVRELKAKNSELETQLASAKSRGPSAPPATEGGGSWEAMKRKMLANLEGEGDDGDEDRQEERAQIADTIRATDEALARKDQELAELKSRLAEAAHAKPSEDEAVEQLLDADEVIAGHRARIAKLEEEMTDKLRAAELELSVERAKITRETAHLAGLKADIDSMRASGIDPQAAPGAAQQPKRRWLSKLGLNGDDEDGK